ncbi:hypothetical protein CR513_18740, partial [Mucuna pruriens]
MATTDAEYDSTSKGRQLSKAETTSAHQASNPYQAAKNLHREHEKKLLKVLQQNKKEIRKNLIILDVVKKEVTKLLAVEIIYPILDSNWVNLVQVVPKKSGMTVARNQYVEMVPTRIQNSWWVCIDYRKLNIATHKDHFPFVVYRSSLGKASREVLLLLPRWIF